MPRGILVPVVLPKGYDNDLIRYLPGTGVAGDPVNGHMFRATGKEFIYAQSTGGSINITVLAGLDPYGRAGANFVGNLPSTNYDNVTQVFPVMGWAQPDGFIYVNVSSAGVVLYLFQIPDFPDAP